MVVRNPFERIISAYEVKFNAIIDNHYFLHIIIQHFKQQNSMILEFDQIESSNRFDCYK